MKKLLFISVFFTAMSAAALAENISVDWNALNLSEEAAESASDIIAGDADALMELNGASVLTDEEKEELRIENLLLADCGSFGYNFVDLDGSGTPELIIATNCPDDEFFGKMLLEVYTLDSEDQYAPVLKSEERNRFYYCGGNRIANIGSNSAEDSMDTVYAFENGKLVDQKTASDPAQYVQMDLAMIDLSQDENVLEPDYSVNMADNLTDCTLSVGLTLPGDADETSLYALIYDENLFDDADQIAHIQPGCILRVAGEDIEVTSVETENGSIVINGGSVNGGIELVNEEDTNGFFAVRNGKHLYTLMGQAQLTMADTVSVNGKQVVRADVGTELASLGTSFEPDRLSVRIEKGLVVEIEAAM